VEDKPLKIERIRKSDCWRFAVADTALTENRKNDPTGVAIVDVERKEGGKNRIIVVDMMNFYAEAPEVKRILQSLIVKHKLAFIGVEDTLDGKHIIQQFKMAGLPIKMVKTDGKDKVMRAVPLSLDMENEQVWFIGGAPWLSRVESQLLLFPNDLHDEDVDCLAYSCNVARKKEFLLPEKSAGVAVKLNGRTEVIRPGTMGWETGMHEIFGPKPDSIFKKGRGEEKKRGQPKW
jgi:predicted phage terminase large subunit-like protein